jgi:hypothetical protein
VVSYREQTFKAVIVPVNETDMDITAIRQTLKEIYGPVGIHWEVTEEKGYSYFGENKFFEEKSGLLNSYTPAMREMNADFRDNFKKGDIDPQANYVFILKYSGSTMDRDAAGFMPRGGQFGYIFTKDFQGDAEILQTIAHELGHGKLLLKHTFDKDYGIAQGTTDNLMDYARGKTHLAKWQWDVLADPGIAQGVFDKDEDGMVAASDDVKINDLFDWIKKQDKKNTKFADYLYLNYRTIFNKPLKAKINNKEISVYAEVSDNGLIDLKQPEIKFVIDNKYHSGFYASFPYIDKEKDAIRLWTYSYNDFMELLNYLNYEITPQTKYSIIDQYKGYISESKNNCNKIDVIFETVPDFVLPQISDEDKYACLNSLSNCPVLTLKSWIWDNSLDTDERQAIINLLKGIDIDFFAKKYDQSAGLFNTLFNLLDNSGKGVLFEVLSLAGLAYWKDEQISKAPYYVYDDVTMNYRDIGGGFDLIAGICFFEPATNLYNIGFNLNSYDKDSPVANKTDFYLEGTAQTFDPVYTKIQDINLFIPAYFAKTMTDLKLSEAKRNILNFSISSMLIEANLIKFKLVTLKSLFTKVFNESDLINMNKIVPTGINNSYIGAKQILTNAKRAKPTANSILATKVDNYLNSIPNQGEIGEEIAKFIIRDIDGFTIHPCKHPCKLNGSDNGFDIVAIKGSLDNPTSIWIIESKPINNGAINLGITQGKGTQMSDLWINGTISQMRQSGISNLTTIGNSLYNNAGKIERYVLSIDKGTKEIVILKLDKF